MTPSPSGHDWAGLDVVAAGPTNGARPPSRPVPDDPDGTVPGPDEIAARQARLAEAAEDADREKYRKALRYRKDAEEQVAAEREAEAARKRRLRLTPASAFRIKPVRWVWAGRMPVGEITLIPGREGAGKSTFLAWQAAALTRGELPGMFHGEPRGVLYAATEDSWEYTIAPRMIAAGADMGRVFRIDVEHEEGRFGKLSLPVDTRLIPEAAREVGAAALMCDPVISIIDDSINTFKAQELRGALEPLKRAVEEAGIALAGLVHFNKSKDTDVLSMISGSRAWPEVARAVIAIAVDKDADEYTCVVSQVKNNLGRSDLVHLKYTIDTHVIRAADHGAAVEDVEIGRLRWTGESERGAEEILQAKPEAAVTSDATQAVMAFIGERFRASGQRVPMAVLTDRFVGDDMTAGALKKILERALNRGEVRRPARGMYEPGSVQQKRVCPGCGGDAGDGGNFCRRCARQLDDQDRKAGGDGDRLF